MLRSHCKQQGATLLEFGVVVTIFGILCVVLLNSMRYYQERAEKVVMEATARNIRSGLRFELAHRMIHQRHAEIPQLASENPVKWLSSPPSNYLGEFAGPPAKLEKGSWYFDVREQCLVYVVNIGEHFQPQQGLPKQVRYQVTLVYGQAQQDRKAADNRVVEDVILKQRELYRWF